MSFNRAQLLAHAVQQGRQMAGWPRSMHNTNYTNGLHEGCSFCIICGVYVILGFGNSENKRKYHEPDEAGIIC